MPDLVARKTASGCGFKRLRLSLSGPQETLSHCDKVSPSCPCQLRTGSFDL
jgi:hypothetical protein